MGSCSFAISVEYTVIGGSDEDSTWMSAGRVSQVLNVLQLVRYNKESMRLAAVHLPAVWNALLLVEVTKTPCGCLLPVCRKC
jgi:hypothetical protein